MAINKVDLTVTQLVNDLNEGLTWLKKDDLGYGSIEVKYNANEKQISAIRKHPALKNAETTITIFNIIDDTKNETPATKNNATTQESKSIGTTLVSKPEMVPMDSNNAAVGASDSSAADIFANL